MRPVGAALLSARCAPAPDSDGRGARSPALVVDLLPSDERQAKFFDGVEGRHPQELLLQRADDALGTAIAFGRTHERRTRFDSPERDLVLEVASEGLRAVTVANREPFGDVLADRAEGKRKRA